MYHLRKADDKFNALIHQLEDLFKKRNNSDKHHLHQNQTVLKRHNFDKVVIQDFQNVTAQKLDQEVISILAHEIESTAVSIHCQSMRLQLLQLHLNLKKFFCFCVTHLASVFIKQENKLEFLDNFDDKSNESQLDININQLSQDKDSTETSTQLL